MKFKFALLGLVLALITCLVVGYFYFSVVFPTVSFGNTGITTQTVTLRLGEELHVDSQHTLVLSNVEKIEFVIILNEGTYCQSTYTIILPNNFSTFVVGEKTFKVTDVQAGQNPQVTLEVIKK